MDFPVIILTARDAWVDKSEGFLAGADEYLTQPFLAQELVARLRALIRRAHGHRVNWVRCGNLTYHPTSGSFALDEWPIRLAAF